MIKTKQDLREYLEADKVQYYHRLRQKANLHIYPNTMGPGLDLRHAGYRMIGASFK